MKTIQKVVFGSIMTCALLIGASAAFADGASDFCKTCVNSTPNCCYVSNCPNGGVVENCGKCSFNSGCTLIRGTGYCDSTTNCG